MSRSQSVDFDPERNKAPTDYHEDVVVSLSNYRDHEGCCGGN